MDGNFPKLKNQLLPVCLRHIIFFSNQALKETDEKEKTAALENLKSFAGSWIAILCNEDDRPTLPGRGIYDRLHQEIRERIAQLPEVAQLAAIEEKLKPDDLQAKEKKALQKERKLAVEKLQNRLMTSTEMHQLVCEKVKAEASKRDAENGGSAGCDDPQKDIYTKAFSSKTTIGENFKPFADSALQNSMAYRRLTNDCTVYKKLAQRICTRSAMSFIVFFGAFHQTHQNKQ